MDIAQLNAKVEASRARLDDIRMRSIEYGHIFRMDLESCLPEISCLGESVILLVKLRMNARVSLNTG